MLISQCLAGQSLPLLLIYFTALVTSSLVMVVALILKQQMTFRGKCYALGGKSQIKVTPDKDAPFPRANAITVTAEINERAFSLRGELRIIDTMKLSASEPEEM